MNCKLRQFRVTYARPAIITYANGRGNISSVPIIDDHLPVTISTVNTNDILTIDIETKPKAKRRIMYGSSVFNVPSVVPEFPR